MLLRFLPAGVLAAALLTGQRPEMRDIHASIDMVIATLFTCSSLT